jgi:hypothetical protein
MGRILSVYLKKPSWNREPANGERARKNDLRSAFPESRIAAAAAMLDIPP